MASVAERDTPWEQWTSTRPGAAPRAPPTVPPVASCRGKGREYVGEHRCAWAQSLAARHKALQRSAVLSRSPASSCPAVGPPR